MVTGKFHNEDLSVYFFIKFLDINGTPLGDIAQIVDGYPYNEIEEGTLVIPTVSIEASMTSDEGAGEMGASWFRRTWAIDIFAQTDVQRDDLADRIFQALDVAIPIKDYSEGYRKETGKSRAGTDLRIIEYMNPEDRSIRPTYAFNLYAKIKYWRATVTFETVSTQAS
uniref:Uncharacterized protein n=1 Tax=viral metagenome TaxID=1070528 RepID=A0A6M3LKZ9_9ZZZZ